MLNSRLSACLLLCSLFSTQYAVLSRAVAQEVQWRTNYNQARKEALAKNLPLLLDFGTERCFWCKRLDATTFQDPRLVEVMNERFIPIKVDGERDARLTEALRVQSYPTLVLAAPDGRILGMLEGYMDAGRLSDHLQRVLAGLGNPEWMARDYQEAARAIASSDYARAIALLKSITVDGKDLPVQVKAKQVLRDLEQQASGRLARAKQLDEKGQTKEAVAQLSELSRIFAGTQAAAESGQLLAALAAKQAAAESGQLLAALAAKQAAAESGQLLAALAAKPEVQGQVRVRQARDLLAQAREDYRTQQYLCCLDRCERLATSYADLPEGGEGVQLATEIKDNPEWLLQACETLTGRLSALYLALADTCIKKNQLLQAARYLERILISYPGTPQAEAARVRLSNLQGQPTWQAEFKRP
jgi:thioredoxin-related protein